MALFKPTKGSFSKGARFSVAKGKVSAPKMPKGKAATIKVARPKAYTKKAKV